MFFFMKYGANEQAYGLMVSGYRCWPLEDGESDGEGVGLWTSSIHTHSVKHSDSQIVFFLYV